jgi:hypothetical protein
MAHVCSLRNIALGSVVFAWVLVAGCEVNIISTDPPYVAGTGGSSSSSSSSGSSSSSSGMAAMGGSGGMAGSGGADGGMPDSGMPACAMGTRVAFAVDQLFLGDTETDGTPNAANAWKSFGFDIDGRLSTQGSTGLCKPAAGGSSAAVYPDGNVGIDNSFGKNLLPIFLGLAADLATLNNEAIATGDYTYLLSIFNPDQEACATSASFFLGGDLGKEPLFNGSDVWPIDASSLVDPAKPDSAKTKFTITELEGGTVEAGPPSQFNLLLNVAGFNMVIPIRQARMSFKFDPDFASISEGQIGGVIRTEDMVKEVARVAAAFDVAFCNPQNPALQSVLNGVRRASDIMQNGTQDPTKVCDGISIGLGFTMKPVKMGKVVVAVPPPANPCIP